MEEGEYKQRFSVILRGTSDGVETDYEKDKWQE